MTDRKKIIETIRTSGYGYFITHDNADVEEVLAQTADALIAAGIGDTTNLIVENEVLQRDIDNLTRTLEEGTEELQEAQRYAARAERALLNACVNLIKDKEDNVNMELLARVVYTNYLRKAEKELAEERKE